MAEAGVIANGPISCARESAESHTAEPKVVIHLHSGSLLKGVIAVRGSSDPSELFADENHPEVDVRLLESKEWVHIPIQEVKAIFFVKSYRGDAEREALHFYSQGPELGPIWAEVRFDDGEVIEGKIENTARHLVGDGFVIRPTDAGGNNLFVYVNKAAVQSYRVLGVRATPSRQS